MPRFEKTWLIVLSTMLAALILTAFLLCWFTTEHRKYVINDLPKGDAIYDLLTDEVLDSFIVNMNALDKSTKLIHEARNIRATHDLEKLFTAIEPKPTSGNWVVDGWLGNNSYDFQKETLRMHALTIISESSAYYSMEYTDKKITCAKFSLELSCSRVYDTDQYECSTNLVAISDLSLREKLLNNFLTQLDELQTEITAIGDRAQTAINAAKSAWEKKKAAQKKATEDCLRQHYK